MSVYVDPLLPCIPNATWRWRDSCHLFADSLEELHAFAARLGLKRAWFQNRQDLPHYDLTERRRAIAVQLGAAEVSRKELVAHVRSNRAKRLSQSRPLNYDLPCLLSAATRMEAT